MNMTLVWPNPTSLRMWIWYDWSCEMFNQAWSTNWYAMRREWWVITTVSIDTWMTMSLFMNTTLGWSNSISLCMSSRQHWGCGVFNQTWSTNWYTKQRKWWIIVTVGIDAWITTVFLYEYDISLVKPHFIMHVKQIALKLWHI